MTFLSMGLVYFSVLVMSVSTILNIVRKILATARRLREEG